MLSAALKALVLLHPLKVLCASPLHHQRLHRSSHQKRFDLDHNDVPDLCVPGRDGSAQCLLDDGSWTTFATTTYSATGEVTSTTGTAATSTETALPTGTLPDPAEFKSGNGTSWTIEHVGNLAFSGVLGAARLSGDKCRTSVLGGSVIWSCGDMQCANSWTICGFSMGPAFYGTSSVMTVNTSGVRYVQDNDFALPWIGDEEPVYPQTQWGMDTSNIAPLNDSTGIAYVWEIWRGAPDGSISDRGAGVVAVTLEETKPVATRLGPLLTGPDAIQIGLFAVLRDGDHIYTYSMGGPTGMIVGRVSADVDAVFDATQYEFLEAGDFMTWSTPSTGIPVAKSIEYGMQTAEPSGTFGCTVYGSVFWNNYLNKYTMLCTIFQSFTNMYVADNPWGPWSAEYSILNGWIGYGSMAHPVYSANGSHKELYFSQGPDGPFHMFKITFDL